MSLGESLKVLIGADADPLVKELAKAQRSINEWGRTAQESIEKVRGAAETFGALVGVALGGSILELGKSTLENAAAFQEQAEQLGINVEKLQAFRIAAQMAGVDQDTLNVGLNKLSKLLGEAAGGSAEAQKIFQKWSVSLRDSNGNFVNLDTLLGRVANRFESISDPAFRSAAAVDMFGKSGYSLINFLSQGSKGLAEMEDKARAMGAVMSEETTKKAKEAADQLKILGDVISAHLTTSIVNFLPTGEKLNKWLDELKLGLGMLTGQKSFADSSDIDDIQHAMDRLIAKRNELQSSPFSLFNKPQIDRDNDLINAYQAKIDALKEHMRITATPSEDGQKQTNFKPIDLNAIEAAKQAQEAYAKAEQSVAEYIAKLHEENTELGLNAEQKTIQKNMFEAEAIARRGNIQLSEEQIVQIMTESEAIAESTKRQEEAKKQMEENRQFANQLASSMTSSMESAITSGNGLRSVFAGLAEDIAKMILRMLILKPIAESLSSAFGGLGLFSGGSATAVAGARAAGGPVSGNLPYLVGENGPEIMVPNHSGMVIPNHQISSFGSAGGGATMHSNFNFNVNVSGPAAGDPRTGAQSGAAFANAAKAVLMDALQEQMRAGGMLYGR